MLRLRQQTHHDVMLQLSPSDCDELLVALGQLQSSGHAIMNVDVHASLFKVRVPRVLTARLMRAEADEMRREGDELTWGLEADTCGAIADKVKLARKRGIFAVAELATVMGPNREWIRLFAEMKS